MHSIRGAIAALVTGVAATLVILALAVLPFLSPPWVAFGQARAEATLWTGFTTEELRTVTDAILADLVVGPPEFDVALDGAPVLVERERQHMRDVRSVFAGFFAAAAVSALVLVGAFLVARGPEARATFWRRLARTGVAIVVVTVVGGVAGVLLFDQAFELFHRLFFPPGSYLFDPTSDRLVQLFPQAFWIDSSIAVGVVVIALATAMWWIASRHSAALGARAVAAAIPAGDPVAAR